MKSVVKKVRDAQYYYFVIDKLYESISTTKNVFKRSDMFNILTQANVFYGLEDNKTTSYVILKKLETILEKFIEKVEGDKVSDTLYSLKINGNDDKVVLSEMKAQVTKYFGLKYSRKDKNSISNKERRKTVKKSTIVNCYKIFNWMVENKEKVMRRNVILNALGFQNIQSTQVDSWVKTIEDFNGTIIDLAYISTRDKTFEGYLKSENPGDGLISVIKLGNELYNLFPDNKFNNKPVYVKKNFTINKESVNKSDKDHNLSKLLYSVAGIVVGNEYKSVEIDNICSNLDKKFDIKITKKEIISILKNYPEEFDLIEHGERIRLNNNSSSWEEIKKEHGPKNFTKEVLVRLTFEQGLIQRYFPSAKVISRISEHDAIYKITYSESISDLINWIDLYRKFRESDKILNDEELEQTINREIERINALSFSSSLRYKLEI